MDTYLRERVTKKWTMNLTASIVEIIIQNNGITLNYISKIHLEINSKQNLTKRNFNEYLKIKYFRN